MCKTGCIPPQAIFNTEPSRLPERGLTSQAKLCHQNTLTGVLHQMRYSVLLPLILFWCIWCIKIESQHLHLAARTCLCIEPIWKGITVLKQWVKHRNNNSNRNTTLTKVAPTLSKLCSNTEATNAQCSYCPLAMGPIVRDVLCLLQPERLSLLGVGVYIVQTVLYVW